MNMETNSDRNEISENNSESAFDCSDNVSSGIYVLLHSKKRKVVKPIQYSSEEETKVQGENVGNSESDFDFRHDVNSGSDVLLHSNKRKVVKRI